MHAFFRARCGSEKNKNQLFAGLRAEKPSREHPGQGKDIDDGLKPGINSRIQRQMPRWAAFWKGHTMPLKASSVATCSQRRDTECAHREGKLILVLKKSPVLPMYFRGLHEATHLPWERMFIVDTPISCWASDGVSDTCANPGAIRIPSRPGGVGTCL